MNNITKTLDDRPTRKRVAREQVVIDIVARCVGTSRGFVMADDVASDIILELLDAGGFHWEEEEIERFCRRRAAYMVLKYVHRREKNECEFSLSDGGLCQIIDLQTYQGALQDIIIDANNAKALLPFLPNAQRQALEILCDGGNPIDIAEEMGVKPWDAIVLIRQARDWIDRVGPMDEVA